MELGNVLNISDPFGLCLKEVHNEVYDVADIVRAPRSVYSMGPGEMIC